MHKAKDEGRESDGTRGILGAPSHRSAPSRSSNAAFLPLSSRKSRDVRAGPGKLSRCPLTCSLRLVESSLVLRCNLGISIFLQTYTVLASTQF